jgi:hypothetical protein
MLLICRVAEPRDAKAVFLVLQSDAVEWHECNVEHEEGRAQEGVKFDEGCWL